MRYLTSIFMFSLFIYLTIIRNSDGNRVQVKFRAGLLLLSFFIFDRAREGTIFPAYGDYVTGIVLYATVNVVFWWGFDAARRKYEIPPPRQGMSILKMQIREDINEFKRDYLKR